MPCCNVRLGHLAELRWAVYLTHVAIPVESEMIKIGVLGIIVASSLLCPNIAVSQATESEVLVATPDGVPVEENGKFITSGGEVDHSPGALKNIDIMVRVVRANGYRCDSVTAYSPYVFSRGFELKCNHFDYTYDFEDKGKGYEFVPPK